MFVFPLLSLSLAPTFLSQEMKEFRPKKVFSRRREILQTVTSLGFSLFAKE